MNYAAVIPLAFASAPLHLSLWPLVVFSLVSVKPKLSVLRSA